jgi:hypothetical protein
MIVYSGPMFCGGLGKKYEQTGEVPASTAKHCNMWNAAGLETFSNQYRRT